MSRLLPICGCILGVLLSDATSAQEPDPIQQAKDAKIVETLQRLEGFDISGRPDIKAAVLRHLTTIKKTEPYLMLVRRFELKETSDELLSLVLEDPASTLGVESAKLLVKLGEMPRLTKLIDGEDADAAAKTLTALGLAGDPSTFDLLASLPLDEKRSAKVRIAAAQALARNRKGEQKLLEFAVAKQLPADLNFTVANALLSSTDEKIRAEAAKHLKLPAGANSKPLPPLAELVKRSGNIDQGRAVFVNVGTCAKCHVVRGEGKEVGPDLSEIGGKLSKEALYVSILDPSAGISHNFETYSAVLEDGNVVSGILVSQTDDAVILKTAEAIVRKLARSEIEILKKQPVSLMPSDLQKNLTAENLVDVVEYLTTLKKK